MDIIKFTNPANPTKMEKGVIINDLKSKMWIERYREPGEFLLVADANSDIRTQLPIGSFITHADTHELMVVENHEISVDKTTTPEIKITGRSFETILDMRIIGSNKTFPVSGKVSDYVCTSNYSWVQAVDLIYNHIDPAPLLDDDNAILYVTASHNLTASGYGAQRNLKRGGLHTRLLELLSVDDLGIRTIRPGGWSPLGATSPNVNLLVHRGVMKTNPSITFSYQSGMIESADYLWTNKALKTGAYVTSTWLETAVYSAQLGGTVIKGFDRKMMYIEASDIDSNLTSPPTTIGGMQAEYIEQMQQRGRDALQKQNKIALTNVHVSNKLIRPAFRLDYEVGDIVYVGGAYRDTELMRVTEYVEMEDENGETGYPTFAEYNN
jgi:Siphovirus ReqiPepy6 Gp37-like protein